jgi:hypothetical protein
MKTQKFWSEDYKLHNFDFSEKEEIVEKIKPIAPKPPEIIKKEPIKIEKFEKVEKFENTEIVWCLPSTKKEFIDDLYQEKKIIYGFGEKKQINIQIMESNDLSLIFRSKEKPDINSIIYIKDQGRWWTVNEIKNDMFYCFPSMEHPSF